MNDVVPLNSFSAQSSWWTDKKQRKTCSKSSNKYNFTLISTYLSFSLSLLCPLTLLCRWDQSRVHACAVCLLVYVQTSALLLEVTGLTYICPCVLYIFDAAWHTATSSSKSPQVFLSLIYDALSSEYPSHYSLLNLGLCGCDLTTKERGACKRSVFFFLLYFCVHCWTPASRAVRSCIGRHSNEHSALCPALSLISNQWWVAIPPQCTFQHSLYQ